MAKIKITKCLFPGCRNTQATRGLCQGHYVSALRLVREGKATEGDLVKRGLYLPKGTKGRSPIERGAADVFRMGSKVKGDGQ